MKEINGESEFETEVIKANIPVLVDFWAPWCGPCRMVTPILEGLAGEYTGKMTFCKVNVDDRPEIAATFGIQSIPTMIFFKGGKAVDHVIGAGGREAIKAKIDEVLGLEKGG